MVLDTVVCPIVGEPSKVGSYFAATDTRWFGCRERFAIRFKSSTTEIYFSHKGNQGEHIASFISKTEQILDLPTEFYPWRPSSFKNTTKDKVLLVSPSIFWLRCPIRRSLFTLLLRSGLKYDKFKNNWEEALYSESYLRKTRKAVMRFMYGFNEYAGPEDYRGWRDCFKNLTESEIRDKLVLPDGMVSPAYGIGENMLWV